LQKITSLGHVEAQLAIETIQAELIKRNAAAAIAVADASGELVALLRMDGTKLAPGRIAANKAWTAARERKPSGDIGRAVRDPQGGFDISYYGDPRYIGWDGGLPVVVDGAVVGAVAVSGLSGEEDVELAQMGVAAILKEAG
jgi:glc operon protein GlcG